MSRTYPGSCLCRATLMAAVFMSAALPAAEPQRVLAATIEPAEGSTIDVHVGVGTLLLAAGDGNTIEVRVELMPRDHAPADPVSVAATEAIAGARLAQRRDGGWTYLELDLPVELRQGDVKEHWTVRVPAAFGAEVEMAVGQMTVENLGGGLNLQLGVGDMKVSVPHGDVAASVSLGDLDVRSATASAGDISLDSRVGHSTLKLRGKSLRGTSPGGPGSSLRVPGEGVDAITLSVDVGNVALQILERR